MRKPRPFRSVAAFGLVLATPILAAQQRADPDFDVSVRRPAFPAGNGPVVAIDQAHHNFHTASGRYRAFAEVLRADGYRVREAGDPFAAASLGGIDILVIANPGTDSLSSWSLPTRSAFRLEEIEAVEQWVQAGGALLLIADHMPAAGASAALAERFGLLLSNGYTLDTTRAAGMAGDLFTRTDGTLLDHPITRGRDQGERIDSVVTFTGQAFQVVNATAATILRFGPAAVTLLPPVAGVGFDSTTPRVRSGGWAHAAALTVGRGRVAVFGEAAMFSAQLAGSEARPMGMNHPSAARNKQILLNTLHWLSGLVRGRA